MNDYLIHFNPYHDALGRFAKSTISVVSKGAEVANEVERQKRIAKNVAIGAAVVGGVLATGVTVSYLRQQNYERSKARISRSFETNQMMDIPATQIAAGQILNRVSTAVENGFRGDYTYATVTPADKHRYAYAMGKERGTDSLFEMTLRATKPINVPSSVEQKKMFDDLFSSKQDSSFRDAIYDHYGVGFAGNNPASASDLNPMVYEQFVDSWYRDKYTDGKTPSDVRMFRDYAKSQGYDALLDMTDAGIIGDRPLYVIDPKDSLTIEKVKKMNRGRRVANGLFVKGMGDMRTVDYR